MKPPTRRKRHRIRRNRGRAARRRQISQSRPPSRGLPRKDGERQDCYAAVIACAISPERSVAALEQATGDDRAAICGALIWIA